MTAPHLAYYQSVADKWTGEVTLELTDAAAFASAPLSWIDRLRISGQMRMPPWLGPARLATSVVVLDERCVVHSTRLVVAGLTMFEGKEHITLLPDGHRFELRGEHRFAPDSWRRRPVHGTGRVDANEAQYDLEWLGVSLRQHATALPDGETVTLNQQTAFMKSTQVLRRVFHLDSPVDWR